MSKDDVQDINWNVNVEDLPDDVINEWEFNIKPANDKGESDIMTGRIEPTLGRIVDELIQEAKSQGLPIKTRSDFVRLAIFRCVVDIQKHFKVDNERITHYLVLEKQAMNEAQKSAMLARVLTSVQALTKGLAILSTSQRQDWGEVNRRISQFLKPIMEMRTSEPFLSKLYVRELFEYKRFKEVLERLKDNKKYISKTIREAEKFYES